MIADESGSLDHALNNEICNDDRDGGVGVLQTTTKSFKGLGSGMTNISKTNDCDKGFGWTGATSEYYSNTHQGIYANIKDAYRIMQIKFGNGIVTKALATTSPSFFTKDDLVIDKKDMGAILTVRAFNGFKGSEECYRTNGNNYIKKVGDNMLDIGSFFPGYEYDDAEHNDIARKLILANEYKTEIYTCSPVYLQILNDSEDLIAGYNGSGIINTTDRIVYDEGYYKHASIIFPVDDYVYRLIGTSMGTYDLVAFNTNEGVEKKFSADDIPVSGGEVHQYDIDWGKNSALIKIDIDGDGVFESTFTSDLELTAIEFVEGVSKSNSKVSVCHVPPGNSENEHTLSISASALSAHLKHGDYEGACDGRNAGSGVKGKSTNNKPVNNSKSKGKNK